MGAGGCWQVLLCGIGGSRVVEQALMILEIESQGLIYSCPDFLAKNIEPRSVIVAAILGF
jgi:hypothetical protein